MGPFDQRVEDAAALARRWGRSSMSGGRRIAVVGAVGAIGVLGLTAHGSAPAGATSRLHSRLAAPDAKAAPAQGARAAIADHGEVLPAAQGQTGPSDSSSASQHAAQISAFRQIILPDILIVAPKGLTPAQVGRLRKIAGVRNMITFDGAQITVGGRSVSAIGVDPATFRSWVPLRTASDQPFWTALNRGDFVAAASVTQRLGLKPGAKYQTMGLAGSKRPTYWVAATSCVSLSRFQTVHRKGPYFV